MKSILGASAFIALLLGAGIASAQVRDTAVITPPANTKVVTPPTGEQTDFVVIKNGIVRMNQTGSMVNLTSTYTCTDGSVVNTDATLIRKDGTMVKLREGDKVYKNGRLETAQ